MIHSASGKISKVLIIVNGSVTLPHPSRRSISGDHAPPRVPQTVASFRKYGIEVFFAVNFPPTLFHEYTDTLAEDRRSFHGYLPMLDRNDATESASPEPWAQDVFEVITLNGKDELRYNSGGRFVFKQIAAVALRRPDISVVEDFDFPKGGNLLFGGVSGVSYLITTVPAEENEKKAQTWSQYYERIKAYYPDLRHCILKNNYPPRLQKSFYHTDLYITIGGIIPYRSVSKETVFIAKPDSNVESTEQLALDHIEKVKQQIKAFASQTGLPITLSDLPMYIVDSGVDCFTLTYCNCHVENYRAENSKVIRFRFPDYTGPLKEYLQISEKGRAEAAKTNLSPRQRAWRQLLNRLGMGENDADNGTRNVDESAPPLTVAEVEQQVATIQRRLEARLTKIDIAVEFIKEEQNDKSVYVSLAKNFHGSLHCVAKVIERTPG